MEGWKDKKILTEWTALGGKTRELDLEHDAGAVRAGNGRDGTLHVSSVGVEGGVEGVGWQGRRVDGSSRVVGHDGGIAGGGGGHG